MHLRERFDGSLMKIKQLEPTEAKRALGCFIAQASEQETQLEVLRDKFVTWYRKVQSSHLSSENKIKAYHVKIEKKLLSHLLTTSLTYTQNKQ